jgi:hypothetical protein
VVNVILVSLRFFELFGVSLLFFASSEELYLRSLIILFWNKSYMLGEYLFY